MGPEEANYAYEKYAELTGLKKSGFEIPDSLIALFIAGSFIVFIEAILLRNTTLNDPIYLFLLKFAKNGAIVLNSILSVVILMLLVLASAYIIKNEKIAAIPVLLFCLYKLAVMSGLF